MAWDTHRNVDYSHSLKRLLMHLRTRCEACVERGENASPVNLDDPLACACRCAAITPILDQAQQLQNQLAGE